MGSCVRKHRRAKHKSSYRTDPEEAEKDIADSMGDRKQLRGVPGLGPEVWPNGLLPPGKGRLARQSMASRQFEENLGLMGLS